MNWWPRWKAYLSRDVAPGPPGKGRRDWAALWAWCNRADDAARREHAERELERVAQARHAKTPDKPPP